jgi:hypothetical protein
MKTRKQIRHNPSRFVTVFEAAVYPSYPNRPNPSQSVTRFCDGSVTDFREEKAHKYREKLSLYIDPSRCHAHPRAMRAHAYKGGVTDFRDGFDFQSRIAPRHQYDFTSPVRSCGSTILMQYDFDAVRFCVTLEFRYFRAILGTRRVREQSPS